MNSGCGIVDAAKESDSIQIFSIQRIVIRRIL